MLLAAALAWMTTLLIVSPMGAVHGDGYYTWLWARSIVFDGDVDFENDYRVCDDPWSLARTDQGDVINQWNPGASVFWIPILLWDRVTGHPATRSHDRREALGCIGPLAERAVRGSLVAGFLTVLLSFFVARRACGEGPALFAAIAIGVMSPLTYYATMLLSYGHAASAATGAIAVWAWDRQRRRPTSWGWLAIGAAIGLAMLTRPQNAVLAILPLYTWIEHLVPMVRARAGRGIARHVALGLAYTIMMLAVFAPQVWQWWDSQGELFFVPQGRHYMRWGSPRLVQVLFSTTNGLLVWSPILYLAFFGLGRLAWKRETRSLGMPLLLLVLVTTYVNACVTDWWGAIGFPGRRFDSVSLPFAIGIAASIEEIARAARSSPSLVPALAAGALTLVLGAWNTATDLAATSAVRMDVGHRSDRMALDLWARVLTPVRDAIGHPFALPASIPFAIRYRIRPVAWELAGAQELFLHDWLTLRRRPEEATFDFVERHAELLVGFDDSIETIGGRRVRRIRGEHARAIVPVSWPEIGSLRFVLAREPSATEPAHVWLELDGEDLGSHRIDPDDRELRVLVAQPHQGILELRMRVVGGSIGLSSMEMLDPLPSPQEREREHLRSVAERRRAWRASRRGASGDASRTETEAQNGDT